MKSRKPGLFVNCGQLQCSRIRIRIPNTDPDSDPGKPKQCGSGSTTLGACMYYFFNQIFQHSQYRSGFGSRKAKAMRIRIHNTGCMYVLFLNQIFQLLLIEEINFIFASFLVPRPCITMFLSTVDKWEFYF